MERIDMSRLIRALCIALVAVVLTLALILVVAVTGGSTAEGVPEETTRRGYVPSLPDEPLDPEEISDIIGTDWGDVSLEPDDPRPPEPDMTLPDWESGMEWPTLPPSPEIDPDFEWPTLPEGWDTLPPEWDTLPEDWGDIELPEDIADFISGMDGNLGLPPGALAAGIASQLTVMDIYAEQDDTLYLKMQSFGDYTGQGWTEAEAYNQMYGIAGYSALYIPYYLMNENNVFVGYPLKITPKMNVRVIPYYLTTAGERAQLQTSDVKAVGDASRPYTLYYRPYGIHTYAALAADSLARYEAAYADFVRKNYLAVDDTTLAYLRLIIKQQGFDKDDPDIVEKVAYYIRNAADYSLTYDSNLDREPNVALAFLGAYKEGVCRHFATAATLLYRALGIPARYTVGFAADVKGGETTAVKGMDAHAWVEVYEEGFGWRYVEVTGSPAQGDPDDPPYDPPETETGTGSDTLPPVDPDEDPKTWGDVIAGTNGQLHVSDGIPAPVLNGTICTVTSDVSGRLLLKLKSFGDYMGASFASSAHDGGSFYGYSPAYLTGLYLTSLGLPTASLYVESPVGTCVAPYYVSPTQIPSASITVGDNRVTGDSKAGYTLVYIPYTWDFTRPESVSAIHAELYAQTAAYYTHGSGSDYLDELIARMGWSAEDPNVIRAVAAYLKTVCALNPAYDEALDSEEDVVYAFLHEYREGSVRHFAAAATLIYRALGIPARYTVGYAAEAVQDTAVVVRGTDAYAWVEVLIEGMGWVAVDVVELTLDDQSLLGDITLKPVDMAAPYSGEVVRHDGRLTGFEAFEILGYTYEATVQGEWSSLGRVPATLTQVTLYDPNGVDVTHRFRITKETGSVLVYLEELWVRSSDVTKVYDGTPLETSRAVTVEGTLPEGYSLRILPTGSRVTVGSSPAAFTVEVIYKNPAGEEAVHNDLFLIHTEPGTLTVTPAALTVKAADAEKVYDGTELTAHSLEMIGGSLAEGDSIADYTVEGSQTRVGRSENIITAITIRNKAGEDVTLSYAIETLAGVLRVTIS